MKTCVLKKRAAIVHIPQMIPSRASRLTHTLCREGAFSEAASAFSFDVAATSEIAGLPSEIVRAGAVDKFIHLRYLGVWHGRLRASG